MPLLAHFSDAHLVAPFSRGGWLLNPKQALACANWWSRRRWRQNPAALAAAVQEILRRRADLVIVTGDHAQMGRAADYAFFGEQLAPLRHAHVPTLLLAGNHDHYSTFARAHAFLARLRLEMSLHLAWDGFSPLRLPGLDVLPVGGACPTPAFQCWGALNAAELERLRGAWAALPPAPGQTRVACGHFPLLAPDGGPLSEKTGLRGAGEVLALLRQAGAQAYLCGHVHRAFSLSLPGGIAQHCAGSLTLGGRLQFFRCDGGAAPAPEP